MLKKIILVFKTHFDIGFTDLSENVIHRYGNEMLRQVIETCRATEDLGALRYVWTMPAWPLWYIVNNCAPELKADLDHYIENGQIVWHSLPFTSHTDFSVCEEYTRGLDYSRLLSARYGKPIPHAAKMTDVPGHGRMLPRILSGAGIRFLHLGCNEFAMPPQVPTLFFWEGAEGESVLTMYSKGGYGSGIQPPKDWNFPVWMALMHTQDNCGPQSADLIRSIAAKAQAQYPEAEIVCGTLDDFYDALSQCDLSAVPVIREDLADTWIHGVGSYPKEVHIMRACREKARRLSARYYEALQNGTTIPEAESLWQEYDENVALFTEHTWGADVKTFLGPNRVYEKEEFLAAKDSDAYRFMERSWNEQRTRAARAAAALDRIEALLGACPAPAAEGSPLEIAEDGNLVTVRGGRYSLTFDAASGRICTLTDCCLDAPLLTAREEAALSYRYDRVGIEEITEFLRSYGYRFTTWGIQDYGRENYPNCDHITSLPRFTGWRAEDNTLVLDYTAQGETADYGDCRRLSLLLTFGESLELELNLQDKSETPFVEFGSLVLPLSDMKAITVGKPGGPVDPTREILENCNHALFNLERQVTVSGEKACLTVVSHDVPLFGIGTPGVYEYRKTYGEPRANTLYFNLFNTMWGTNFPQWIGGNLSFRFTLRSFAPDSGFCPDTWAAQVHGTETLLPGLELVQARAQDGGILLALRDLTGEARDASLEIPGAQIAATDLFGRPETCGTDCLSFRVKPYGIHTFSIKR